MNLLSMVAEVVPARTLNQLYIFIDIIFLIFFVGLLVKKKRYLTTIFALAGGVIYFLVDYGYFYLILGTRVVEGADPFWFLLWLSMSYGITNFAWIWLWIKKDKHLLEWSILILAWWVAAPLIANTFGNDFEIVRIYRGTSAYHGIMAILMFVGYAILCIHNMYKEKKINIVWLLIIGILVQFAWEAALLISGIRDTGFAPLIVDSLIETNMGIPYIYFIYVFVSKRFNEDLSQNTVLELNPEVVSNEEIVEVKS